MARKAAAEAATSDERERAELVRESADHRRFARATAELQAYQMTWLPALLSDAAEDDEQIRPLVEDLKRIWADERVQRLLLAETSQGWPAQAIPENEGFGPRQHNQQAVETQERRP